MTLLKSAALRAARTFLSTFLATITAGPLLDVHVATIKFAAIAGASAVLAVAQRYLDDTAVPTIPPG